MRKFRLYGLRDGKRLHLGVVPRKYAYLVNAPFKISDRCCDVMKKNPMNKFEKETGKHPFMGVMASDSARRERDYLKSGCNIMEKHPSSKPLGFWLESDVWNYIKLHSLPYSKIYDMGEMRTGCIYCMFGCQHEEYPNRFRRMKMMHPKLWEYCMIKLKLAEVLRYIGVDSGIDLLDGYFKQVN